MPKNTFLNLSYEKQKKIIESSKEEFARVPIQEVSIKNIVDDAGIARGSFYQYFESKEDLLIYILEEHTKELDSKLKTKIEDTKGDLFEIYVFLYDLMVENFVENEEKKLFKQIFTNIKSSDENIFNLIKSTKPQSIETYYNLLNKENLKIENYDDFKIICDMLNAIMRRTIIKNFKNNASKEQCRKIFLKELEYLKYGIIKKEEKNA